MRALMLMSLTASLLLPAAALADRDDERRAQHREGGVRAEQRAFESRGREERGIERRDDRRDERRAEHRDDRRDDRRAEHRADRQDWRDRDQHRDRRHDDRRDDWRRDRHDDRRDVVIHRDVHRHYYDYDPRRDRRHDRGHRHWRDRWDDGWRHTYYGPRRVIYIGGRDRHHYHLTPSYYAHFYDPFYFHDGVHLHIGCRYHDAWDAIAAGLVIGAIIGEW